MPPGRRCSTPIRSSPGCRARHPACSPSEGYPRSSPSSSETASSRAARGRVASPTSSRSHRFAASPTACVASCSPLRCDCWPSSSGACTRCTATTCRSMPGSTTGRIGTSSCYPGRRGWQGSSSAPASGSTPFRPSTRPRSCALRRRLAEVLLAETPRRVDRGAEVQALVLGLLDQHHGLDRIHVVDALLLALGRNLRLVRPVVELHLRDAGDAAHLTEIKLDLVQVLGEIDRIQ